MKRGVKDSPGMLYLHFGHKETFLAAGFYALEPPELLTFRRQISGDAKKWRKAVAALAASGLTLAPMEPLSRLPRGFDPGMDEDLAAHVKLRHYLVRRDLIGSEMRSRSLIDTTTEFTRAARPLLDFGWSALDEQKKSLEERHRTG
jgi:uncharacterized protein (TIGR02453 family)